MHDVIAQHVPVAEGTKRGAELFGSTILIPDHFSPQSFCSLTMLAAILPPTSNQVSAYDSIFGSLGEISFYIKLIYK